jgi:DNA excision repair protein ERCC-2
MHTPGGKSTVPVICAIHNLHLKVSKEKKGKVVDARCRDLTNTATVNKARTEPRSVEVCDFHEVGNFSFLLALRYHSKTYWKNMNEIAHDKLLSPGGIWTLADILQHGRETSTCPYFTIRRSVCSRLLFFATEN